MNVMNVREDEASQPVKSWRHSRKQAFVSPSNPSLKEPQILQDPCTPFKAAENRDRKGGCAFLPAWKHEQCIKEMAWGLDTDTFLNAFARFTSRRGVSKEVISDRGTNFVGAVGELKKLVSRIDRQQLLNKTAELGVTWRFNPPGAPHFGGAHEVLVKAAKKAIYAVAGD